ncbi:MAG: hypothetical protein QM703_17970 [Gemmatales bacterium]
MRISLLLWSLPASGALLLLVCSGCEKREPKIIVPTGEGLIVSTGLKAAGDMSRAPRKGPPASEEKEEPAKEPEKKTAPDDASKTKPGAESAGTKAAEKPPEKAADKPAAPPAKAPEKPPVKN